MSEARRGVYRNQAQEPLHPIQANLSGKIIVRMMIIVTKEDCCPMVLIKISIKSKPRTRTRREMNMLTGVLIFI